MPKKILFYYCVAAGYNTLYLGTAHLYLKTYIDVTDPDLAKNIEWLHAQQVYLPDAELIKLCNDNDIDYLCTSHYIWNNTEIMQQLSRIKDNLNPKIKVISGGPSIAVNVDTSFFTKYPFIDYAVYGPGEQAFHDLMEYLSGKRKTLHHQFTNNLAWEDKDKQKTRVAPYQYVKMLQESPFLHNAEILKEMISREKRFGVQIVLPYDLTRGCPYACTFCDWNSGLSNKVSRRKDTYKEEIDLFHEAGVNIVYLSDANIGQYQEDIDMVSYFAEKNLLEGANFKIMGNFSKLRKENNLKIYHLMARGRLVLQGFVFSCQDTHKEILDNIDRPDISWPEHAKMIDDLTAAYPYIPCQVQLIQGLPGQTLKTWRETLATVSQHQVQLMTFLNELLPASPASYNTEYQDKFHYVYSQSERFMGTDMAADHKFYRGNFSQSCVSFTREDYIAMTIMSHFYGMLCGMKFKLREFSPHWDIENIVDKFFESSYYQRLYDNLDKNWQDDKYYYTINFDGKPKLISACLGHEAGFTWMKCAELQKFLISNIKNEKLQHALEKFNWRTVSYYDPVHYNV